MKFSPIYSVSPRVLHSVIIPSDPPIHLEVIHDPKDGKRYLAIGVGGKTIRRAWLSGDDAVRLTKEVLSMTIELWSK